MKIGLGFFSLLAIASMIGVSVWATGLVSIVPIIQDLIANPEYGGNPWLIATLFDAYFGFLWFWIWLAYKETSWLTRIAWLVGILLLGNMTAGAYLLLQLWKLPAEASVKDLLLRAEA